MCHIICDYFFYCLNIVLAKINNIVVSSIGIKLPTEYYFIIVFSGKRNIIVSNSFFFTILLFFSYYLYIFFFLSARKLG